MIMSFFQCELKKQKKILIKIKKQKKAKKKEGKLGMARFVN